MSTDDIEPVLTAPESPARQLVTWESGPAARVQGCTWGAGMPRQTTRVRLELLVPVAIPAIMPLSWDFVAHWFGFGSAEQRQPEQGRNRRSGLVSELLAHFGKTRTEAPPDGGLTISGGIRGYVAVSSQAAYDIHVPWQGYPYLPPIRVVRERDPAQLNTGRGFPRPGSARSPAHPSRPGTPLAGHGLALEAGEESPPRRCTWL
jgi:hypothetical protein